jgi:8-oxo-dGTP pyrophosphatase MutT (NUDIX family)
MSAASDAAEPKRRPPAVSCGTLVVNARGELLLCHVTGTAKWDIPKGLQDPGESPLQAARREMQEEAGVSFDESLFQDLGCFDYRPDKRLHLFRVRAPAAFDDLGHLCCTSHFPHHLTGALTPEVDGFRWAGRREIRRLCWPRMAARLLSLSW